MVFVVFCLYLAALLAIGGACARRNKTLADFILGGRRLGPWVTAISAQASDMSAWLLIGLPGAAYAAGLSMVWTILGCAAGTVFNWLVVAPRLREAAGKANALTVPDVLEARLGGGRNLPLRTVAVGAILLFYASYIAAQFIAAGKAFETTFSDVALPWGGKGFGYTGGLLLGGGVILIYTMLGGFLAVAYTDLLQGLLMVLGVVILPIAGFLALPAESSFLELLARRGQGFASLWGGSPGDAFLLGTVVGNLSWGLGYPGQPHILARFMAIRRREELRRAALIGIVWVLVALTGAFFLGLVAAALPMDKLADSDLVMPVMAHRFLPPILEGLLIAAAIAAMMSTVDSQVVVAVAAVERDILDRLLGVTLSEKRAVLLARAVTLFLGGAGIAIALRRENVFAKVFDAWGGLGATLAPALLLSLLWKGAHRIGIVAGMLIGFAVVQKWPALVAGSALEPIGALAPAFLANLLVAVAVSAVWRLFRPARSSG